MFRKIFQIVLYLGAGVYAVLGIRKIAIFAMNPDADGVILIIGFFFLAVFAVAQAIVRNHPEGIRAAAKNVPDLNAPGRDGTTLLYFAVGETWHKEPWVESVKTLLSLGADPNYNNGRENSFALAHSAEGSTLVLRAMLDGGGDPNGRDVEGVPIILSNWERARAVGSYTQSESRSRFDLLLERGADINSTFPETGPCCDGYSLLLYRTSMGVERSSGSAKWPAEERAYADALHFLERGARPRTALPAME